MRLAIAHFCFTFLSPWRGSPEEGRRSGFDSHEVQRAPEPPPGSTPGRHFNLVTRCENRDQWFAPHAS